MRAELAERFRSTFGRAPEWMARAPGRIEFIGNHTDYNGGPVIGAAIDRAVWVGLARRRDGIRRFASGQQTEVIEVAARGEQRLEGAQAWGNYPLGVLMAMRELGLPVPAGFDYLAVSDLPTGAGLSSSAAIELASALAFLAAEGATVPREELVRLGRRAENSFVGVPCGLLDQGVSAFGRKDRLVLIDCRIPRFETLPLPAGAHAWIFNTPQRHALIDGLYAERHGECLAAAEALRVPQLVDASPAQLAAAESRIPPAVYRRARHVIEEIARVRETIAALAQADLGAVGRLLSASHRSSRMWFENSTAELDFLVDRLALQPGVYGARLTGGGFGGAVLALTADAFGSTQAEEVAAAYAERYGPPPQILHLRTDDGAALVA